MSLHHPPHARRKKMLFAMVMLALLFAATNQTVTGTITPRIVSDWGNTGSMTELFNVFMLVSAVATALAGSLSDVYGRKPLLVAGTSILLVGTLLSGLAGSVEQLIVFRGIQGCGVGIVIAIAFTVVGDLFDPGERGRWLGLLTSVYGAASLLGPLVGGYMVDHASWRWAFFVSSPLGIIALIFIVRLYPGRPRTPDRTVDYPGTAWFALCLTALLLAVSHIGNGHSWTSPTAIGLLALSCTAAYMMLVRSRKVPHPVLPVTLLKNRMFSLSSLIGFTTSISMFGTMMYAPLFFQDVMLTSAAVSGMMMVSLTLSLVAAHAAVGWILTVTGRHRTAAIIGLIVMLAGNLLLSGMQPNTGAFEAVLYLAVYGIGLGTALSVYALTAQNAVEQAVLGAATATYQLFRQLGATIGVSVMGSVIEQRMRREAYDDQSQAVRIELLDHSIEIVFYIGAIATLLALCMSLWVKGKRENEREGDNPNVACALHYRQSEE